MENLLLNQVTEKANLWLSGNYSEETKKEVRRMLDSDDKTELIESFYRDLEFGTGGLRGIMGTGSNRMNIYTVGAATQGLSNYLKKNFADLPQISVAVGHDCRNNSRLFAETAADIFSANGIKVYLFDELRPTPEISFAIRYFGCQSGVMVTASHNPREYNGYKAYWNDGAQIISPHDINIIAEVEKIKSPDEIHFAGNKNLIETIGENIDKIYLDKVKTILLSPDAISRNKDLKIVYTPIHGTGYRLIPRELKEIGFENVITVPEQMVVSGDFPTVTSPNPEEPAALDMAIKTAKEFDADIVMASDPDADRMGIAVKDDKNEWILVNGNQTCMLFTYYIITRKRQLGALKPTDFMVKTIVTTELEKVICDKNGVELFDCYTGFKWIAAVVRELEGKRQYIGGGEESYGYMPADFVRDKDAVASCSLMAEITAWAKDNGKTLFELLQDIYVEYGFSKEKGISIVRKGKTGAEEIVAMMKNYRENPPKEIAGSEIVEIKDYQTLLKTDISTGKTEKLDYPVPSNVLQYFTADGTKVSVRPSGTEPKIKFYIEVKSPLASRTDYNKVDAKLTEKIESVRRSLGV
ncbi:MAG: phospho-sugar mutase [Prevotellaceae bacterium]|jgi:phosphoglucomutase|nr:phospho-sugar mutase [Prevotellaceae bacterium]